MATIQETLAEKLQLKPGQFSGYATDLYILPMDADQRHAITDYLASNKMSYEISYSNVKGQAWYGKMFIEVPFARYSVVPEEKELCGK